MNEQFQRTELLLGACSTSRLKKCRVAVFGAGGVGGYVIEALARSGVGTLDITDGDTVDITNLNRQIIATHNTIGMNKVDLFEERIHSICPDTTVIKHNGFYLPTDNNHDRGELSETRSRSVAHGKVSAQKVSESSPLSHSSSDDDPPTRRMIDHSEYEFEKFDYVVDAIDTVAAKLDIICRCTELCIPVISSMGCGNRLDPSLLKETDIFSTSGDPLAKVMRKQLKLRGVKKLKVVYSEEEPRKPGGHTPGSTPFVPASAGLMIAGIVVRELLTEQRR